MYQKAEHQWQHLRFRRDLYGFLGINKEPSNICKKLIRNTAIDLKMEGNRVLGKKINPEKMVNFCKK